MGRRLSLLLTGSLALAGTAVLGPPAAQAATNDLFRAYTATMPGSSPANVAVGDVTGDGRPDVVMTTGYSSDAAHDFSVFIYPQQTDGSLGAPTQVQTGAADGSGMGIALGDVDGDGHLDAAVSTTNGVMIFRQAGGTLSYAQTVPAGDAQDVRLADLNGDGHADLVTNASDGVHVWWQVNSGFAEGPVLGNGSHVEVDTGDVTGDGLVDVVAATNTGVEVYAQQQDHTFAAPVTYASGGTAPWNTVNGLAVGDTNGDGVADVHLSVGGNKPNSWVVTRYATPTGTLGAPVVRASGDVPEALEVADVTGDGRNDLVVVHGGWDELGVYDSTPGTDPSEVLYALPYASHYKAEGLALGDVSGDGRLDALVADYNNGLVELRSALPGADTTPPDTTITSGPAQLLRSRSASFSFTADEPSTFTCSMDAAAWTPCTSPASYDGLAQGAHRFQVRATDSAGNVEPMAAGWSFSVDGPDTTITGGTSGTIRSTSASFAFSSSPTAASYQCSMDDAAWTTCTSQQTWDGLATGASHTFRVRGVSVDGLVDSTPASRNFDVAPAADVAVTLAGAPNPVRKSGTLTWTATVTNQGAQPAADVTLTEGMPSGFTFGSVTAVPSAPTSAAGSCSASGSPATVRCTLGSLAPGLTWTVTVKGTVTATKGSLAATALGATSTWDLAGANDSASAAVSVGNGR